MPIVKIENISEGVSWGLWKIDEGTEYLINSIPLTELESGEFTTITNLKRKKEWLGARLLLKYMLEQWALPYMGILKDSHDKPYLNDLPVHISLAHCYPYAAIIMDKHQPCGIDIEKPKQTLFQVSHKFLNSKESPFINGSIEKLCVTWAAKEVLYKIKGKKYISFQDHMTIEPFELKSEGRVIARINKDGRQEKFALTYLVTDGHYICFNL